MNQNLPNFASRLSEIMKRKRITQQTLADAAGVSRAAVALWMSGKSEPNSGKIIKAAETLGCSPEFLMFGSGESELPKAKENFVRIKKYVAPASSGVGTCQSQEVAEVENLDVSKSFFRRYIGASTAEHLSIVPARGDSMSPTWNDGDMLIIDELENFINRDGCYVFEFDGALYAKRLCLQPSGILVISDNKMYPPFEIKKQDMDLLHIAGRVVQTYRRDVLF